MLQQHFQNILSWLCTTVEHTGSNATDEIFTLSTTKEARMAFDVLNALGFKVKIYDDENSSRLYISKPRFDKETLIRKLEAARAYSVLMKEIQQAMHTLRGVQKDVSDYSVNLLKNQDDSMRIAITTIKEKSAKELTTSEPAASEMENDMAIDPAQIPVPPRAIPKKKNEFEFVQAGAPAIAKTHLMQSGPNKGKEKDAAQRWLYTNIFRHFFSNSAQLVAVIIILLALSALVVTSKAIICPDFAVSKKQAWYCDREQIRIKLGIVKPQDALLPKEQ